MKFLKVGRVAIITRGRYAGKKVSDTLRTITLVELARSWATKLWWSMSREPRTTRQRTLQDEWSMLKEDIAAMANIRQTWSETDLLSNQVVIIQPVDSGNKSHPYGHALVAGIERYPSKITRRMSKARQEKRSKIKPFIKVVNYNHLMPTRYTLELEGLKGSVSPDTFKEVSQREDAKKTVKKTLEERYTSGKNRWFFTPLRTYLQHFNNYREQARYFPRASRLTNTLTGF
jgi:large subunit ribosomal protein L27e